MDRFCRSCGQDISSMSSRARFCSASCRGRAHRDGDRAGARPLRVLPSPESASLVAAVESEVSSLGVAGPQVELALTLARAIESGAESSSGLASLTRELRALLVELRASRPAEVDTLAQLRARRDARLSDA